MIEYILFNIGVGLVYLLIAMLTSIIIGYIISFDLEIKYPTGHVILILVGLFWPMTVPLAVIGLWIVNAAKLSNYIITNIQKNQNK